MGSYAWLKNCITLAKEGAQIRISKYIPAEEQVLWKFTRADAQTKLYWEHSREFEYKGQMYDIIKSEVRGDTIWYWCYWDRKETDIKRQINEFASYLMGPGQDSRNTGRCITNFFQTLFFPGMQRESNILFDISCSHCLTPYDFPFSLCEIAPPTPPPWWT
jgi:hypothetical protein